MELKTALRRIYFLRWTYHALRWAYRGIRLLGDRAARKIVRGLDCFLFICFPFDAGAKRILLFTGHDARRLTSPAAFFAGKSIWRHAAKKYALLALDMEASDFCRRHGLPFFFPDDFMDEEELCGAFISAEAQWGEFVDRSLPHAAVSGINWFAEDSEALHWYKKEISFMTVLVAGLRKRDFSELAFVRHVPPLPAVYYYESSVWREFLVRNHPDIARPIPVAAPSASPAAPEDAAQAPLPDLLPDACALIALGAGESFRFSATLKNLMRFCPRKYAIIFIGGTEEQAMRLRLDFAVPVFMAPAMPMLRDASIFPSFMEKIHELFQGEWKGAAWNLEFYATIRWPSLLRWAGWWEELFRKNAVDVVIGSSLDDLESRIPFLMAKKHGISTFSLPHGYTFIPRINGGCAMEYFGAPSGMQKKIMRSSHPAVKCVESSLIALGAEYPMDRRHGSGDAMTVVVLVKPAFIGESIVPNFSCRKHISALRELKNMDGDIRVRFKVHPKYPDRQLFAAAGIDAGAYVLPIDTDIFSFNPEKTVFIALNYMGGPSYHAAATGIPLITLNTSKMAGQVRYAPLIAEFNGLVFSDTHDAARAARRLCDVQGRRTEIADRQKLFHARLAPDPEDAKILYKVLMSSGGSKGSAGQTEAVKE